MSTIEWTLLLTALLALLIYIYFVKNFNYWKKRGIDGPKPKPLFGNLPSNITQQRSVAYDIDDIYRAYKSKERFVGIFAIRNPQLLITDSKLVQDILVKNFKNFHDNESSAMIDPSVDPIIAKNPFFLVGSEWKDKRSEITPALTANRIKASYPIMQEVCSKMDKYLEQEVSKSNPDGLNAKELAAKYTTEVVANCIYGVEAGAFSSANCKIREMGAKMMDQSFIFIIYFMLFYICPPLVKLFKMSFVSKEVEAFFENLMNEAISLRKKNKSNRVDFLNYLLELKEKKNLSTLEMAAHTMTFFIDGFETSSILISNCLHLLAENQNVQKILRSEIKKASEEGELSFEKLNDLPYLDQCINETLRIRPPVLANSKICTEKCEIRTNKDKIVKVEAGTVVFLPYYSIHHDDDIYPNPETFDPDRFSEQNGGVRKFKEMGAFLPFGDGPRICLGMKFGLSQSKVAVAEIIKNWEIRVNSKTKSDFVLDRKQAFLCVPEGGVWLDFKRINDN